MSLSLKKFFECKSVKLSDSFKVFIELDDEEEIGTGGSIIEIFNCTGFTIPKLEFNEEIQYFGNVSQSFLIPKYDSIKEVNIKFLENESNGFLEYFIGKDPKTGSPLIGNSYELYQIKNTEQYSLNFATYNIKNFDLKSLYIYIYDNNFKNITYSYIFNNLKLSKYELYDLDYSSESPCEFSLTFTFEGFAKGAGELEINTDFERLINSTFDKNNIFIKNKNSKDELTPYKIEQKQEALQPVQLEVAYMDINNDGKEDKVTQIVVDTEAQKNLEKERQEKNAYKAMFDSAERRKASSSFFSKNTSKQDAFKGFKELFEEDNRNITVTGKNGNNITLTVEQSQAFHMAVLMGIEKEEAIDFVTRDLGQLKALYKADNVIDAVGNAFFMPEKFKSFGQMEYNLNNQQKAAYEAFYDIWSKNPNWKKDVEEFKKVMEITTSRQDVWDYVKRLDLDDSDESLYIFSKMYYASKGDLNTIKNFWNMENHL